MDGSALDGRTVRAVNPSARHVFLSGIDATEVIRIAAVGGSAKVGNGESVANDR